MTHFEAMVRIFDVNESNASAARRAIEDRLRVAGFTRWQVARVGPQRTITARVETYRAETHRAETRRPMVRSDVSFVGGGMLVAAVVAWTLWFLWLLAS
jgi:hypothetical protein